MKFFARITERCTTDPQEGRAMAALRLRSIDWMMGIQANPEVEYLFRDEDNRSTIMFLDCGSHLGLHKLLDADPLISYSKLFLEPLLTPAEMVMALSEYLKLDEERLTTEQFEELRFPSRPIDPQGSYYLARKVLNAFNPLLS